MLSAKFHCFILSHKIFNLNDFFFIIGRATLVRQCPIFHRLWFHRFHRSCPIFLFFHSRPAACPSVRHEVFSRLDHMNKPDFWKIKRFFAILLSLDHTFSLKLHAMIACDKELYIIRVCNSLLATISNIYLSKTLEKTFVNPNLGQMSQNRPRH